MSPLIVDIIVGLVILAGVIGAVIQIIPSAPVIGIGILGWAIYYNTPTAWIIFAIAAVVLIAATILKFLIPGKKMAASDTPNSTLIIGVVAGIIGWFTIPVAGFFVGALGAIYFLEYQRLNDTKLAWKSLVEVLKNVGLSILIEVLAALIAASTWIVGLVLV
ncbi:MAG: DUF456 family protein [Actinomycetaceae bacterium]|nr:DUF456 family protein [Actinomycetaceae bacterium]